MSANIMSSSITASHAHFGTYNITFDEWRVILIELSRTNTSLLRSAVRKILYLSLHGCSNSTRIYNIKTYIYCTCHYSAYTQVSVTISYTDTRCSFSPAPFWKWCSKCVVPLYCTYILLITEHVRYCSLWVNVYNI